MNIRNIVGLRIKELRGIQQLTQQRLAEIAGIDKTYLNEVESGKRNISIVNLEKIIIGLESSPKDFFDSELFNYTTITD